MIPCPIPHPLASAGTQASLHKKGPLFLTPSPPTSPPPVPSAEGSCLLPTFPPPNTQRLCSQHTYVHAHTY